MTETTDPGSQIYKHILHLCGTLPFRVPDHSVPSLPPPCPPSTHSLLSSGELRNRGYVLDGFPKTTASAKFAFMKVVPLSPEEMALKDKVCGGKEDQVKRREGMKHHRPKRGSLPPHPCSFCMCRVKPSSVCIR